MKKTAQLIVIVIMASAFNGCQSVNLKRGWDSVQVKPVHITVVERAPIGNQQHYLPAHDYWYKHQDNYHPGK